MASSRILPLQLSRVPESLIVAEKDLRPGSGWVNIRPVNTYALEKGYGTRVYGSKFSRKVLLIRGGK